MSLNTILGSSQPDLQPGERILASGNTTDVELRIPATMAGPKRVEYAKGQLWVTNQRIIFIGDLSLIIPYSVLLSSKFNLPLLSANNITLQFLPDPLAPETLPSPGRGASLEVKLVVGEGAHGVYKIIEGERQGWAQRRIEEEQLPVYQA